MSASPLSCSWPRKSWTLQAGSSSGRPGNRPYLVQQSAEKLARAILTGANVKFGTGHNLAQMAEALPDGHPWIEKILPLDPSLTADRFISVVYTAGDSRS